MVKVVGGFEVVKRTRESLSDHTDSQRPVKTLHER